MCPWSWPQPDMIPMMWFRQRCKWCCAPPITSYQEKHSAQESFPDCVLISASVWFYLILIFSKSIILRLDCRLFCVSHLYLPFHFYLSPLFFGGPHQFFHQIPDSIFNGQWVNSLHEVLVAPLGAFPGPGGLPNQSLFSLLRTENLGMGRWLGLPRAGRWHLPGLPRGKQALSYYVKWPVWVRDASQLLQLPGKGSHVFLGGLAGPQDPLWCSDVSGLISLLVSGSRCGHCLLCGC